jgi:putative peptidoglycan lipid II flippase
VRIGIVAMVSNMVLNLLFVVPLHFYWQIGHLGLAAATSVSAFINAILLFIYLRKNQIYQPSGQWLVFYSRLFSAVMAMLLVLILLVTQFNVLESEIWQQGDWVQRVSGIAGLCMVGLITYVATLFVTGFRLSDLSGPAKAVSRNP